MGIVTVTIGSGRNMHDELTVSEPTADHDDEPERHLIMTNQTTMDSETQTTL
ncbi:hypothetical protein DOY81_005061 [Sarcophaga bullata]|nr:hypothetical protein DOY81_005061 [Sarcophaga bullata]